jgi:YesN/AraC family two-component response regulator
VVKQLRLQWVAARKPGLPEASKKLFEQAFSVCDVDPAHLLDAADGDAADTWDVICFDFDYPDMATLKLIPQAKRRWPSAPILMLTLHNSADLALWALRSRVFDLLVKPVTAEDVERTVERIQAALLARRTQAARRSQEGRAQLPAEVRFKPRVSGTTRLQAAIAYVDKHYSQRISESEVALLCGMPPSRFCRAFKAAFEVTFVEYLANARVMQAKRLLANPAMPVADVAFAVGFTDPSYFTRVFRKQEGVSPTEYRSAQSGLPSIEKLMFA